MRNRALLAILLLSGCAMLTKGPQRKSTKPEAIIEPGLIELDVDADGLWYAIGVSQGPWSAHVPFQLFRDGKPVAEGELEYTELGGPGPARVGGFSYSDGRSKAGRLATKGALEPGRYRLDFQLKWRDEYGKPHETRHSEEFEVAAVDSTEGGRPTIAPATWSRRAALRPAERTPFSASQTLDPETKPSDFHFWITLPAPFGQPKTHIDMVWMHGGKVRGTWSHDMDLSWKLEHDLLVAPIAVHGWPENLSVKQVFATDGRWDVHVVQDGAYVTSCSFHAKGGVIGKREERAVRLACAPDAAAPALVRSTAQPKRFAPDPIRAMHARAHSRSAEVRELFHGIQRLRRENQMEEFSYDHAATAEINAITKSGAREARKRKEFAALMSQTGAQVLAKKEAEYQRMVQKHGR